MTARATLRAPEVDASMRVELAYPGGVTGHCVWDMGAGERTMTWPVTGTEGAATSPAFAVPHMDNRLVVTGDGRISEEVLGDQMNHQRRGDPGQRVAAPAQCGRHYTPFGIIQIL